MKVHFVGVAGTGMSALAQILVDPCWDRGHGQEGSGLCGSASGAESGEQSAEELGRVSWAHILGVRLQ